MGRKFARVSLGAIGDVKTIRGIPRYVEGSEPGQIVKSLVRTQSMNPVILLDEIEKTSTQEGVHSDVMAALLEILDPEQNPRFIDHYIDYPVDLSNVFFICTANNLGGLSAALLDRVEVIRFTSYSDENKEVIAKNYILPRVLKETGLSDQHIRIEEEVWPLLIRPVGFDAGIRQLERNIYTLVRSAARKIVTGSPIPIVINKENMREFVLPDQGTLS
jgi:ATP-dependent Lon protease